MHQLRGRERGGELAQGHGKALDVELFEEAGLIAGWLFRQDGPMLLRRGLHDLPSEHPFQLRREPATEKEKASSLAYLLHHLGDRRLNIDLRQHFDKVGVGDEEVSLWPHRPE